MELFSRPPRRVRNRQTSMDYIDEYRYVKVAAGATIDTPFTLGCAFRNRT